MSVTKRIKVLVFAIIAGLSGSPYADEAVLDISKADIFTVNKSDLTRIVYLNGTLQPLQMVNVNAQVDGEIAEVLVREGDAVKKGQTLARFETVELIARLNERNAALDGARAQQSLAQKNFDKVQNLFSKKYISQSDYDAAQNQLTIAVSNVKAAESGVDLAKKSLADAEVKSPLDGIVSERIAEPGQRTAMHVKIFVVVNLKELEFTASVPSADIPLIHIGQTANFWVDGFGTRTFSATVTRINPMASAGSRTYYVYLRVPNEDQALRGGMLAKGDLVVDTKTNVLSVPGSAVRDNASGEKVVYLIQNGTIQETPVEIGLVDTASSMIEIKKGISAGAILLNNRAKVESGRSVHLLDN